MLFVCCVCVWQCELSCASVGYTYLLRSGKFRHTTDDLCLAWYPTTCQHSPSHKCCQNKLHHPPMLHVCVNMIHTCTFLLREAHHISWMFFDKLFLFLFFSFACRLTLQTDLFSFRFWTFYAAVSVPSTPTEVPDDEDEDEFDDSEETSAEAEADDDGRIYKNPRNSPSSDCPRDEEQATLLGQKCLRKCSSHEDCKSKKKKCLCDAACGMSCIKPGKKANHCFTHQDVSNQHSLSFWIIFTDRECPELPQPEEIGSVNITGREFGGKAVYSCPLGYNVIGVRLLFFYTNFNWMILIISFSSSLQLSTRLCRNGQWTGTQPICSKNSKLSFYSLWNVWKWENSSVWLSIFVFLNSILFDTTGYWARTPLSFAGTRNIRTRLNCAISLLYGLRYCRFSTCKMFGYRWFG